MAEYILKDSKGKEIRGYISTPGRTILEILREHLDTLPDEYTLGIQHAIDVITGPYNFPKDWDGYEHSDKALP